MKLPACIFLLAYAVSAQTRAADEDAVRATVQKYMDARDHQDAHELAEVFTPDADQLVSSGEWRKGSDDLVTGTLASSRTSGGRRTVTLTSIRFLAPDVAVADGRYELTGLAGGQTRSMWSTFVLTRDATRWRIAAIRNMLPAAPVASK